VTTDPVNTYRLVCNVMEIIFKDEKRSLKVMCDPGSMIIETPDSKDIQLGDKLVIKGTIHIESIETITDKD
jgi:hypothetical protein